MKRLLKCFLAIAIVVASFCIQKAELFAQETPQGNHVSLTVAVDETCQKLIEINPSSYSLKGIEYTLYTSSGKAVGCFVLDEKGVGYQKGTSMEYIDQLADGDYYLQMSKTVNGYSLDPRKTNITLKSDTHLPQSFEVNTVADMYGKNSSGNYFSYNQYKLWTVNYGTGVFECGVAEVKAPSSITSSFGNHTISTSSSRVLERQGNELIYKILYYGRSGPGQWEGFSSGKYYYPFTTRNDSTYYATDKVEALAAFVTHVTLARAWNANSKWSLQWPQSGVEEFWNYVQSAANAPDDFVVYVWENYQKDGTQDMFYGFMLQPADYTEEKISLTLKPSFDPISIILSKESSNKERIPDAQFTIDYYTESFTTVQKASEYQPKKTWVFQTNQNGVLTYDASCLISGDELFYDSSTKNYVMLAGSYVVTETKAPQGYLASEPFVISVSSDTSTAPIYYNASGNRLLTNQADGYLLLEYHTGYCQINKRTAQKTNVSLENSQYTIYTDEQCKTIAKDEKGNLAILTTDQNGNTNTISIAPGSYYIKETKAPVGFKLDEKVYSVTVEEFKTTIVESVEELAKINVSIHKTDDKTGVSIPQATYGIYCGDRFVAQLVTDSKGRAEVTLDYTLEGYILKEISAPEGYQLDTKDYPIILNGNDDQKIEIELTDQKDTTKITILKVSEDNEPLEGVEFMLMNKEGQMIQDIYGNDSLGTTDQDGLVTFEVEMLMECFVKEMKTLDGYILNEEIIPVSTNQKRIEIKLTNQKETFKVKVTKVDEEGGHLPNVEFSIYDKNDELVKDIYGKDCVGLTDENGVLEFELFVLGEYYLKETKTLDGYVLSEEIYPVNKDNNVIEVINKKETFKVKVTKVDEEGGHLSNVEFSIYDQNDELVKDIYGKDCVGLTDENGVLEFELFVLGDYYLKETKALDGYVLSEEIYPINKENNEIEVINKKETFKVKVTKVDEEGGHLSNVEFSIYDQNDELVKDIYGKDCVGLTDENGILEFELFVLGEYYLKETKTLDGYVLSEEIYPLNQENNELEIVNELIPEDPIIPVEEIPQTGDLLFIVSAVTSVCSLAGLIIMIKKKLEC